VLVVLGKLYEYVCVACDFSVELAIRAASFVKARWGQQSSGQNSLSPQNSVVDF
jgi:hypothetical protein